ncbi:MAG: hypothetical protein ACI8QZ_001361 [Chlamydiales bacterium]|jgi:hypothetical protein
MTRIALAALFASALVPSVDVATEYTTERGLRIEVTSEFHMETVDFSMTRDGEPVERSWDGGAGSDAKRSVVMIDTVVTEEDGRPTIVRREFESVVSEMSMSMGDDEREIEQECPLDGVTLELASDGDQVTAEVVDGSSPDDTKLLEGHSMTIALDALLPGTEVEAGDSWEISGEDLAHALGFDIDDKLFPRPAREETGGREEGGRGGRGMTPAQGQYFRFGDWEVEATLGSEPEDYEGQDCYVITVAGQASGELPERERGGERGGQRGGGRNGAIGLLSSSALIETTFEAAMEATLYISVDGRHPVHFELQATFDEDMLREMERGDRVLAISSMREAEFEYSVDVSSVESDDD